MAKVPNVNVEIRAIFMMFSAEIFGLSGLNISFVKTPAAMLSVVLTELAVANIIEPRMSPNNPSGKTSLLQISLDPIEIERSLFS